MPSCRSAPVSPGTWTASLGCAPPPTGGQERSALPIGPASPPQCAGCADSTGRQQRSPVAGGIVIPFVQAQVLGAFRARHYDALQGRPQEFRIVHVGSSHRHAQGSPAASTRMLFLLPALPRSVGLRPMAPPQNEPCPWSSPPTAIPSPLRPVLRSPPPEQPRCPPALPAPPSAGRSGG